MAADTAAAFGSGPCGGSLGGQMLEVGLGSEVQPEGEALGQSLAEPLSVPVAIATLTQNILGSGILALPFAFKSAGVAGGLALLLINYAMSVFSMGLLVVLANTLGSFSYQGFASETLRKYWPAVAEVWVLCYNLGICVSYPILLGDFLHALAGRFLAEGAAARLSKSFCSAAAVLLVCWPLSCASSLGKLKWMSILGIASIGFACVAVVKRYADGTYDDPTRQPCVALDLATFGRCFPILVGAFGAHYNIPALYKEVAPGAGARDWGKTSAGRSASRRMGRVILAALTLSGLVYGTVGLVVYLTFGGGTESDFSENFNQRDSWLVVVRLTMAFAICASFPLTMVSARTAMFNIALKPRGWVMTRALRIALTTALAALCLILGIIAGNIGVVLSYNGSIFGTPVCYVAPAAMYLAMPRSSQRSMLRAFSALCAITGLLFGLLGVIVTARAAG